MDSPRKETSYEEATNQYYAQEEYKKEMNKTRPTRDTAKLRILRKQLKEAGLLID